MEDDVGANLGDRLLHLREIADVTFNFLREGVRPDDFVQIRVGRRGQTQAANLCVEGFQPKGEPGAFESRMSRYEDLFVSVKGIKHEIIFTRWRRVATAACPTRRVSSGTRGLAGYPYRPKSRDGGKC